MDVSDTYESWLVSQWNMLRPATRMQMPATLEGVEALAADVARNGSECDSSAETLAIVTEGLLVELRQLRATVAAMSPLCEEVENWDGQFIGEETSYDLRLKGALETYRAAKNGESK
jgi:hypothetical protein